MITLNDKELASKFPMLVFLVKRVSEIDPQTEDALEILSVFRQLRWSVEEAYEAIMGEKFPKEAGE
jgi:hypothetical protein